MKAKSILSIVARSRCENGTSILQVATDVYRILTDLGEIDSIFLRPVHFNGGRERELDLNKHTVKDVGRVILDTYWNEITKYEDNKKPDLNYRRQNEGFSFNAKYMQDGNKMFYVNIGIGYNFNGIDIGNFNQEIQYDYSWYKTILFKIIGCFQPYYATIRLTNQPSNIFYNQLNIKYPIGWITFFSNDFKPQIPDDLSEVRYEYVSEGKYLYTSDEDFLKDKDSYFGYREKLRRIITEIKERVPEFSTESLS